MLRRKRIHSRTLAYLSTITAIVIFNGFLCVRHLKLERSLDSIVIRVKLFDITLLSIQDSPRSILYLAETNRDSPGLMRKTYPHLNTMKPDYAFSDTPIDPRKFQYRINKARDVCKNSSYDMFIYVHSSTANHERRRVLRETWANKSLLKSFNVGLVFITGILTNESEAMANVAAESNRYGDIVQTGYVDSYTNITIKSTTSLSWVATYCAPYVPVILKTDDDMFVNMTRLMNFVKIDFPKIISVKGDKLILCNLWIASRVVRDQSNPYYIPKEIYKNEYYPPFCQGSALIITSKAVMALRQALIGAQFFPLDDVLITGFTAPKAGVKLIPINYRHLKTLKIRNITSHELQSDFFFVHTNMENLLKLWNHQ